jgi:arylsulfatase A-like enzyme
MNIIYILLDQVRKDMLGAYGHQIVKTPNIDRLAKDGVRFNNASFRLWACTDFTLYRFNAIHTWYHS